MAQPSDLPNRNIKASKEQAVIEGQAEGAQEVTSFDAEIAAEEVAQSSGDDEIDSLVNGALSVQRDGAPEDQELSVEELIDSASDELVKDEEKFELENDDYQSPLDQVERPLSAAEEFRVRAAGAMSTSPEQKKRLLQKAFSALGKDFEVVEKGGKLKFRKKGSRKFFDVDPEGADNFREVLADIFADNAEVLLEATAGIGTEIASVKAGTLAGAAIGSGAGPIGSLVVAATGGLAGLVAGFPLATKASQVAREQALAAFDETFEGDENFLLNTGLNAVSFGAGSLLAKSGKAIAGSMREFLKSSPKATLKSAAEVRQSFEQFKTSVFKNLPPESGSKREIGEQVGNAIDEAGTDLGNRLGLIRSEFQLKAGTGPLPSENYLKAITDELQDAGVSGQEMAMIASAGNKPSKEILELRSDILKRVEEGSHLGDGDQGAAFVDKLFDELEIVNRKGGLDAQTLLNKAQEWKKPAGFSRKTKTSVPITKAKGRARKIQQSLAKDELTNYEQVFAGDPIRASFLKNAKEEFGAKIGAIDEFKKIFQNKKTGETFINTIFRGEKRAANIRDLKRILGAESDEFAMIQSEFVDTIYNKAIDTGTGIVKPGAIAKEIKAIGEDAMNEILSPKQVQALQFINKKAGLIPGLQPKVNKADAALAIDMGQVVASNFTNSNAKVRVLWNLTRSNANVAEFLADDGLLKIATRSKNPIFRSEMFQFIEGFRATLRGANRKLLSRPKSPSKDQRVMLEELFQDVAKGTKAAPTKSTKKALTDVSEAIGELDIPRSKIPVKSIGVGSSIGAKVKGEQNN